MPRCGSCGSSIVFGGVREGDGVYCCEACRQRGVVGSVAAHMPDEAIAEHVREVHAGACPKCGGPGPIDIHTSHTIWSALYLSSWRSKPEVCCRRCGTKAKIGGLAFSGVLGWWGFPFGLIMTPVQIVRNLGGIFSATDPHQPSPQLTEMVRAHLAAQFLEHSRQMDSLADDERPAAE